MGLQQLCFCGEPLLLPNPWENALIVVASSTISVSVSWPFLGTDSFQRVMQNLDFLSRKRTCICNIAWSSGTRNPKLRFRSGCWWIIDSICADWSPVLKTYSASHHGCVAGASNLTGPSETLHFSALLVSLLTLRLLVNGTVTDQEEKFGVIFAFSLPLSTHMQTITRTCQIHHLCQGQFQATTAFLLIGILAFSPDHVQPVLQ